LRKGSSLWTWEEEMMMKKTKMIQTETIKMNTIEKKDTMTRTKMALKEEESLEVEEDTEMMKMTRSMRIMDTTLTLSLEMPKEV
jgi:hypothetical protein